MIFLDNRGNHPPYALVQYLFTGEEHQLKRVMPHGNAKGKDAYKRLQPSTREKLKSSVYDKENTTKQILDNVYRESGDVFHARSSSELPRGPKDIYNARHLEKQTNAFSQHSKSNSDDVRKSQWESSVTVENIWTLLERAKREEELSNDSVFIRECLIHPDLFLVLANNRQLQELCQFCTSQQEHSVFGVDPTFNIFDRNISLTVTTFRNLKLINPTTKKAPVFIGPLMMHQRKDWKTFSRFANSLITSNPDLETILAYGTDGEKALIDGFKRHFRFAIFLRCFIHFRDNIKRELTSRGFSSEVKNLFMSEIFGKQDGSTKFCGLVDRESEEEFDEKLEDLKEEWGKRESNDKAGKQTFFEWFKCNKVTNCSY